MKAVVTSPQYCKSCGLCADNCPKEALHISNELNSGGYRIIAVAEELCIGCGICYTVCPDGVFSIAEEQRAGTRNLRPEGATSLREEDQTA